ncbi:DEAD/DEAH box helicase [Desulfopila sp. IMCC35006]|uniref:DEAD/DEAH box helicase n=1 Tax=Desulfopila sp. IMCC35006 TaxID=2569542 RepID=UPI0010ABC36E|nr:DEAD/DEAH box helicase [Desulfopila sp. IMCC35006]TKB28621.1 DEAD/DEAH box helicase [Desulfopila sp. IMCC35006]
MPFSSFGLSKPLLRAVADKEYTVPSPIQQEVIPAVLAGRDVMAAAATGTGKTAGFTLPLLQRLGSGPRVKPNHIRILVLAPTRELAVQVADSVAAYGKYLALKSGVVYGGVKINPQMMKLRGGIDVLVATPGRLLDLFDRNAVQFSQLETLVLDEADRLLELGFLADIRKILALLPPRRQNLLFSATFSSDISLLAERLLHNPVKIDITPKNVAAKTVRQWLIEVDKTRKPALLCHLIRKYNWTQVLVFTRTKEGADRLVQRLMREDFSAVALHGDKSQNERARALAAFKAHEVRILVATDIVARGIDINELPQVVNFDLPKVAEDYIHRIGRTGRAGLPGEAIALVSADEVKLLEAIENLIRLPLVRELEDGFIPVHGVPLTRQMNVRPKKPKKPKKPPQPAQIKKQADKEGLKNVGEGTFAGTKPSRGKRTEERGRARPVTTEEGLPQRRGRSIGPRKKR